MVHKHWSLCRYARGAVYISSCALYLVSLLTLTVINPDRLLSLLLGMRYRQIETLKRTCIITATFWIFSVVAASFSVSHSRISIWYGIVVILSRSVISIASYTKIFRTLRHHQAQLRDHVPQPNALNMARYRKAVNSALWVQLALVVCYLPKFILLLMIIYRKTYSEVVIDGIATIFTYFYYPQ